MKKIIIFFSSLFFALLLVVPVKADVLVNKLKGKILLQVESRGEAWYLNPADSKRYSMGRPEEAFNLMRQLGIGITNDNLKKIRIANENLTGLDSDNDGLSDMAEDSISTDKAKPDSDNDGYNDRDEIINGYNPKGAGKLNIDTNLAKTQAGKILLQVESHGEAWYVNPDNNQRYFLGRPADAFNLMRKLGLGINNKDLGKITVASSAQLANNGNAIDLWSVFDKFNEAIRNKDIAAYNAISYKQVPPAEYEDFKEAAPIMYEITNEVDKDEYINKWQDNKQAIYSTNLRKKGDDQNYIYDQSFLMIINDNGNWKMLTEGPLNLTYHATGKYNNSAEREDNLQKMALDSDKDGLSYQDETCSGLFTASCIKTDPNNKDSDGDGWWDGIEAEM